MGTTAVQRAIAKTDYAEPYINSKDKEPTWDGAIYLYSKPGNVHKKADFKCRIPVQIKGCEKSRIKRSSIKYSVERSDLSNFLKDGGAIFFVVYFNKNGTKEKIYYKLFLPYDLVTLLESDSECKSYSVEFKPFPDDPMLITDILNFFATHKEKQAAIRSKAQLISLEELSKKENISEINITLTSHKPINNPILFMFNHDSYVYATTAAGFNIPVDHFDKISVAQSTQDISITIGNTVYYKHWHIRYEEDCMRYLIGKSITITRHNNENKMNFNFKFGGTLSERILDGEFFLDLMEKHGFSANGIFLPFEPTDSVNFKRDEFCKKIDIYKEAKQVLQFHDVHEELNMDNLSDVDYRMLSLLVNAYNGNEVRLADIGQPYGFINVGNLKILISTKKNEETGLFQIFNFYESMFRLFIKDEQEKMHIVPLPLGLKKEDLVNCSNFSKEKIIKEFAEAQYDSTTSESITLWLLELLRAYDMSKKSILLETAHSIVHLIKQKDRHIDNHTLRLNELQIIKRERNLNVAEKSELYKIISDAKDNVEIIIGAYILLGEVEEAKRLLNGLSQERRQFFKEYPIYALIDAEKHLSQMP